MALKQHLTHFLFYKYSLFHQCHSFDYVFLNEVIFLKSFLVSFFPEAIRVPFVVIASEEMLATL